MRNHKLNTIIGNSNYYRFFYLIIIIFIISNDAIYSPDTSGYLRAAPTRHLGYVFFLRVFKWLPNEFFDLSIMLFQAIFSLYAVDFFIRKISDLLKLDSIIKLVLLAILIFPFFKPLSIANNICPEGISYGLYLFFLAYSLRFIYKDQSKDLIFMTLFYLLLTFTRGQFIILPVLFTFIYLIKHKKQIFSKSRVLKFLTIIILPLLVTLGDSLYHKFKDGIFMTTPFGYVAASGMAFYASTQNDGASIKNKKNQEVFYIAYNNLKENDLLLSSQEQTNTYSEFYKFYHNHVPQICNRTIHKLGKEYFLDKELNTEKNYSLALNTAYYKINKSCKNLTVTLIQNNFKKWIQLYYANISHGFYSSFILLFLVITFFYSLVQTINTKKSDDLSLLLFIFSSLVLSNAMLVAFASHSIMRYLFYNYGLIFLIFVILTKTIKNAVRD